jgi:hypothetical protein
MEALVKLKGPYAIAGGGGGKVWFSYSPSFHFTSFLIPSFLRIVLQKFLFSASRTYVEHLPLEKGSARYPYN